MAILEWWSSLSFAAQIFYCIALPSTLVLAIQTVMMFIGIGDDADAGDFDGDFSGETDVDDIPDTDDVMDASGFDGLRVFTLRGIIAFLVVFGWVGVVMDNASVPLYITIPVAAVCGLGMMFLLAFMFKWVMSLRNDGNADNRNAIGVSGKVHLTVPPARTGEGKVHLMLQGAYVERSAVTDEENPIPTGSEVVVVRVSGETDLVVRRK